MAAVAEAALAAATAQEGETRIVLRNIEWELYETLAERLGEQHLRLTYDRGCWRSRARRRGTNS